MRLGDIKKLRTTFASVAPITAPPTTADPNPLAPTPDVLSSTAPSVAAKHTVSCPSAASAFPAGVDGTSGTVTTLAGVHLGLQRYDRRRVDGLWMDRPDVDRMVETVLSWDFETRVANPCIGADRADLVLAGCAILEAIRAVWPSERLRVADRGLREGILTELMANDGAWRGHRRRGPRP